MHNFFGEYMRVSYIQCFILISCSSIVGMSRQAPTLKVLAIQVLINKEQLTSKATVQQYCHNPKIFTQKLPSIPELLSAIARTILHTHPMHHWILTQTTNDEPKGNIIAKPLFPGYCIAYNHKKDLLLIGSLENNAELWTNQKFIRRLEHYCWVRFVAFDDDNTQLLTGPAPNGLFRWNAQTGDLCPPQTMIDLKTTKNLHITALAINPQKIMIATGSSNGEIALHDMQDGHKISNFNAHDRHIWALDFNHDGTRLLSVASDHWAKVWELPKQEISSEIEHSFPVCAAAFSPDGKRIATASNNTIYTYLEDSTTEEELFENGLISCHGHQGIIERIAFNQDGTLLASASADRTARIWDNKTGNCLRKFSGHTDEIYDILFVPGSNAVITSSKDKTVRWWQFDPTTHLSFNQVMLMLAAYYAAQDKTNYVLPDQLFSEGIEDLPTCLQELIAKTIRMNQT